MLLHKPLIKVVNWIHRIILEAEKVFCGVCFQWGYFFQFLLEVDLSFCKGGNARNNIPEGSLHAIIQIDNFIIDKIDLEQRCLSDDGAYLVKAAFELSHKNIIFLFARAEHLGSFFLKLV